MNITEQINKNLISKFGRLSIVNKNGQKFIWLNDENLPGIKGDYLKTVKQIGKVENEPLNKEEIHYLLNQ